MKVLRSLAASAAVLSAAVTAQVQAADVTLKFGHVGAPGSLFEASVNAYAQCVNDESNGNISSIVVNLPDKTVSVVANSDENSFIDSDIKLENLDVQSTDAIFADHKFSASSLDSSFHNRVLLSPNQVTLDVSMDSFSF